MNTSSELPVFSVWLKRTVVLGLVLVAACTTIEEPPRVIQDTPGSPAVRQAPSRRDQPVPRFDPRALQGSGAVSYTHPTLPTILRVSISVVSGS